MNKTTKIKLTTFILIKSKFIVGFGEQLNYRPRICQFQYAKYNDGLDWTHSTSAYEMAKMAGKAYKKTESIILVFGWLEKEEVRSFNMDQ